eukprot:4393905-Pleurochrysis_carterae.AAC.1
MLRREGRRARHRMYAREQTECVHRPGAPLSGLQEWVDPNQPRAFWCPPPHPTFAQVDAHDGELPVPLRHDDAAGAAPLVRRGRRAPLLPRCRPRALPGPALAIRRHRRQRRHALALGLARGTRQCPHARGVLRVRERAGE